MSAEPAIALHRNVEVEADALLEVLARGTVAARLLGGVAVAMHRHAELPPALHRSYGDIDLAVRRADARALTDVLLARGYVADDGFNHLHGDRRLMFYDEPNVRRLDVFVGSFRMCHVLELDARLMLDPRTLSPADLLLTKLQIVELNPKDIGDAITLLLSHELSEERAGDVIGIDRLTEVTRADWGWFTTFTDNLRVVSSAAAGLLDFSYAARVETQIEQIRRVLEDAPKTLAWRARARLGKHVRWYELPEEVGGPGHG